MTLLSDQELTEVWAGSDKVIGKSIEILRKVSTSCDLCIRSTESIQTSCAELDKRGVAIRVITKITTENTKQAKNLMRAAQVRHLDAISGSFAIADRTDYVGYSSNHKSGSLEKAVASNVDSLVRLQQQFFDVLWEKAVPAEARLREIEGGAEPERTELWKGADEIIQNTLTWYSRSSRLDLCLDSTRVPLMDLVPSVIQSLKNMKSRGIKVRIVTEITPQNVNECVRLAEISDLQHFDGIRGSFGVSDKGFASNATADQPGLAHQVIFSNIAELVTQYQYFLDTLWNKSSPLSARLKSLKDGREPEKIELIPATEKSIAKAFELISRTKDELLVLFPSSRVFKLALTLEVAQLYNKISQDGAAVRILVPQDQDSVVAEPINLLKSSAPNVDLRVTGTNLKTMMTILISDRKEFMSWELRDDSVDDPYQAGGIATYSDIKSVAASYGTIFDNLWRISELADSLRSANTKLADNERAMRDFIDIAAHELRTPIQPILGLSEILKEQVAATSGIGSKSRTKQKSVDPRIAALTAINQKEILDVITRNAVRLQKLAEDILDITRIESGKLKLTKTQVDLSKLVETIVDEYQHSLVHEKGKEVKLVLRGTNRYYQVLADSIRITQVIANLLSNAVKFTDKGTIAVSIEPSTNSAVKSVQISVSDSGRGINPQILDRLFEKFASHSEKGTGLGLYLSKKIIEEHGGKIWVENNSAKGATFVFSLPLLET